jgi:hypothetical protein
MTYVFFCFRLDPNSPNIYESEKETFMSRVKCKVRPVTGYEGS